MKLTKDDSGASREAKRLAAVLLDVLAGARTPPQATETLGVSLPRYYQLEDRALAGFVLACETRPRGRQASAATDVQRLTKENERLKRRTGPLPVAGASDPAHGGCTTAADAGEGDGQATEAQADGAGDASCRAVA